MSRIAPDATASAQQSFGAPVVALWVLAATFLQLMRQRGVPGVGQHLGGGL